MTIATAAVRRTATATRANALEVAYASQDSDSGAVTNPEFGIAAPDEVTVDLYPNKNASVSLPSWKHLDESLQIAISLIDAGGVMMSVIACLQQLSSH